MPCAETNIFYSISFNLYSFGQSSMSHYGLIVFDYANITVGTLMLQNKVSIPSGKINANYIFIQDTCNINLADDCKISGKIYFINKEDYNNIWWTWSDKAMNQYLEQHNITGINYYDEPFSAHFQELTDLHKEHYHHEVDYM
ncbi:MAG: hypothetical protein BGO27_02600 [Alphaproteobacteria bacterium 33-17]|nr:MAG: hypothetical protein BGO27_02600 [Alphaproteobacteria bacterium 33-17]